LLTKAATEPPAAKTPQSPEVEKPPAPAPDEIAEPPSLPAIVDSKLPKEASAGKGECRRYDAIANMTISVACPD
jgi:hypothetical protein